MAEVMKAWLTIQEAADHANVSRSTIKRWMDDGLRHSRHSSRLVRILVNDLDAYQRSKFEVTHKSPRRSRPGHGKTEVIEKTLVGQRGNV